MYLKFNLFKIIKMSFIAVMANLNFQQPLFHYHMILQKSEIILICWFSAQETFLIIVNVENNLIFLWKRWYIFIRILWWIQS